MPRPLLDMLLSDTAVEELLSDDVQLRAFLGVETPLVEAETEDPGARRRPFDNHRRHRQDRRKARHRALEELARRQRARGVSPQTLLLNGKDAHSRSCDLDDPRYAHAQSTIYGVAAAKRHEVGGGPTIGRRNSHQPQYDQSRQVAFEFVVHFVDCLELLPNAPDRVVERHINAIVVVARELAARIDTIAGYHAASRHWPLPSLT